MRGFSGKRILAVLVATLVVSFWAQTGAAVAQTAVEKSVVKKVAPVISPFKPAALSAPEVEIQKRFNELEGKLLDERRKEAEDLIELRRKVLDGWASTVTWWLTGIAVFLVIGGFIGIKIFRDIVNDARESAKEAKQIVVDAQKSAEAAEHVAVDARKSAQDAKELVEEIKGYRDETKAIRDETAESAADEPERVKQVVEDVRENPQSTLVDKAIANALSLQEHGRKDEAIDKWRSIADVVEETDKKLAARAWFSAGFLLGEQKKYKEAIDAYTKALYWNQKNYDAYNNRGNARYALNEYEASIMDYDEAIKLKDDYDIFYYNRGLAHLARDNQEAARLDFERARDLALKARNDALLSSVKQQLQKLDEQ